MVTQTREVERKYEAPAGGAVLPLEDVPGVSAVGKPVVHQLDAVYYDTEDLRLAARGVRLRRRTGGTDAGWHLKRPAGKGSTLEVHAPLGPDTAGAGGAPEVPGDLAALVTSLTRGVPLRPMVRVATRRAERALRGDGAVLALVAEDEVSVERLDDAPPAPAAPERNGDGAPQVPVQSWREVEVELVDGSEELLAAVEQRLLAAGLRPADSGSKAARALGERVRPAWPSPTGAGASGNGSAGTHAGAAVETGAGQDQPGQPKAGKDKAGKKNAAKLGKGKLGKGKLGKGKLGKGKRGKGVTAAQPAPPLPRTAGDVLTAFFRGQVTTVLDYDPRVRRNEYDAVHKIRVATRRLRSALRSFRPLLDAQATAPIGAELRWLAAVLGEVRDAEVLQERLLRDLKDLPGELVLGPVQARVRREMSYRQRLGRQQLLAELSGERYFALLDSLDGLVVAPPLTELAAQPADTTLPPMVRRVARRLDRRFDALPAPGEGRDHARDTELHEARKDAKRLRYAAESVVDVFGTDAQTLAARAEELQELLGDHQDGVVLTPLLRQLGVEAHGAGENGFTFGLLLGQERCRAAAVDGKLGGVRERLADPGVRRWLR